MDLYSSVAKSSKAVMFDKPFYGIILLSMNKVSDRTIPTAGVSQKGVNFQLSINDEFWFSLDPATQTGVLEHEIIHIAMMHLFMRERFADYSLFNIAADVEVNQYVSPKHKGPLWNFIELDSFPGVVLPPKLGTKKYYDILEKAIKNKTSPKLTNLYNSLREGTSQMHETWDKIEKLSKVEKTLLKNQLESHLKKAVEGMKDRGNIPSELDSIIKALFEIHEPVVNWKAYLKQFAGVGKHTFTKLTRRKESKRIPGNPGIKIKHKQQLAIAIDTSGSVSDEDLMEFFNEILHIYRIGIDVTIIECDAGIGKVWEFKGVIPKSVKGRGGTIFDPVIEFVNENYRKFSSLIYLTDGHCPAPKIDPYMPVLWVISSEGTTSYANDYPGTYVQITR